MLLGPLADWQGPGNRGDAVRVIADGSNERLRVQFNAQKSLTGSPNKTDLLITGLARDTQNALRGGYTSVQVVAGYSSDPSNAQVVAAGGLLGAFTSRQGADVVTHCTVLDGGGAMARGAYSRAFSGGTPVAQIVRDLAGALPGVTVGEIDVDGRLNAKGMQFAGATAGQLNKLADHFGFSWSVQGGRFQALSDTRALRTVYSFASESNLLSLTPILAGPLQAQTGVELLALFTPGVKPGDTVRVASALSPRLNGNYKATSVVQSFDSHGPATSKISCLKTPAGV
ncbi:MAG: hypothetical protein H0W40_03760 [Methylibium sp.]|uniref:hypothetical protein n=1 Tax=Methylibium sp. TaxID=2067992 RepID=UPI001850907D|nr:hypothetical protein [Methylibium sp.]MBA3596477.1 hypothetical protein [Methylibium sp.]